MASWTTRRPSTTSNGTSTTPPGGSAPPGPAWSRASTSTGCGGSSTCWATRRATYPVIHITGTNGKGSTARIVSRLLGVCGLTVGTYTQPPPRALQRAHPHRRRGRQRRGVRRGDRGRRPAGAAAGGGAVPLRGADRRGAGPLRRPGRRRGRGRGRPAGPLRRHQRRRRRCGRGDQRRPDHTDFEGDWRRRIAEEKAGIIKGPSHLVLGETDPALRPVFLEEQHAGTWERGPDFGCEANALAVGGRLLTLRTPLHIVRGPVPAPPRRPPGRQRGRRPGRDRGLLRPAAGRRRRPAGLRRGPGAGPLRGAVAATRW